MTPDEASGVTLLLVDDRPANLIALKAILQDSGYHLLTATSGQEALNIALREKVAVVLLDVVMPGMDGFEVARHLKALERTRDLPILFLTALATDGEQIYRAYEVGAVDYIIKPLDAAVVRRKVSVFVDLVRQREQLERQVEELREARHATQLREELLAMVAHDLRNPLSSIRMGAGLLARVTACGAKEVPVGKTAQTILRCSERMDRLIGDLLDFALIQAGRLAVNREEVAADGLIHESLEMFKPLAAQKMLRLTGETQSGLVLSADRDRLLQVLSNLVGNAIKFTPEKGSISLRLEQGAGETIFAVSDTGRGMSEQEMSRMWGRYWQAKRRPEGGVGLGLFISKGLVEAHGGRIWAESTSEIGTTFFFTIPSAEGEATSGT